MSMEIRRARQARRGARWQVPGNALEVALTAVGSEGASHVNIERLAQNICTPEVLTTQYGDV